jgi:hypothetical protein
MVSLENRTGYLTGVINNRKLLSFHNLLLNKSSIGSNEEELTELDEIYLKCIHAIVNNDKSMFELFYNKKSKSTPTKESPFVNDDFIIFCFIVGVMKFNIDKKWIKGIIKLRSRSIITIAFENILDENYHSKNGQFEIILMYLKLNAPSQINDDLLNRAYDSIISNVNLFETKNHFLIISSLNAFDLITELKETNGGKEVYYLRKFQAKFLTIAGFLAWFIQSIIFIGILYGVILLASNYPSFKVVLDKIGTALKITGLIGLSQLTNLLPSIKNKTYEFVLLIFGYPRELNEKTNNSQPLK